MRIATSIIKKYDDENKNLNNLLAHLKAAKNHQCDAVFFPMDFLNSEPINIADMLLFSIKQACILFDISCGFGFIENDQQKEFSSYLVVNDQGEVINHSRLNEKNEPFLFNDQTFSISFYEPISLNNQPFLNILLLKDDATEKQWFMNRLDFYKEITQDFQPVLGINLLSDNACGGVFLINDNQFLLNQPANQAGLSIIDL